VTTAASATVASGSVIGESPLAATLVAPGSAVNLVVSTGPLPSNLTVTKSHTGSFAQSQVGAQYTVTVSNSSGGPTSAPVTVAETIPTGLTLVSMRGTGWTCGTTCTRSDALAAGASYDPITVTVNVLANAPALVTNQVTVSGGGSVSASASDLTVVGPPALRFVPMTPCRVVDTRNAAGPFGGPSISGGGSRDFNIPLARAACHPPRRPIPQCSGGPRRTARLSHLVAHRTDATARLHSQFARRPHQIQCRHRAGRDGRKHQRLR